MNALIILFSVMALVFVIIDPYRDDPQSNTETTANHHSQVRETQLSDDGNV